MRKSKLLSLSLVAMLFFTLLTGCTKSSTQAKGASASGKIKISVICKALNADYWNEVKAGALAGGTEKGVSVTVMGPNAETDINGQVQMIEDQINNNVSAMCIAPSQPAAEIATLDKVAAAKIPVVLIDTDANWSKKVAFVGTGNYKGGELAGQWITKQVDKSAKIAIIRGQLGDATHDQRVQGCQDALKAAGYSVCSVQPANSDENMAFTVMQNMLQKNPDIKAVYCTCDPMALGAERALQQAKATCKLIGFNGDPDALKSILAGQMNASVAQSAYNIGKVGVETAVAALKGEKVSTDIDTGTSIIDKSNAQTTLDFINKILGKS